MKPEREVRFDVTNNQLVLSVPIGRVSLCEDCPDAHVLVLEFASRENLRAVGSGIAHLAKHVTPPTPSGEILS